MFNIYFGLLGFHHNAGMVKGYQQEDKDAKVFLVTFGLIGFCWWNKAATLIMSRVMRLSIDDAALIANAAKIIRERVEIDTEKRYVDQAAHHEYQQARYLKDCRESEEDRRNLRGEIHELKTTIKVLGSLKEKASKFPQRRTKSLNSNKSELGFIPFMD